MFVWKLKLMNSEKYNFISRNKNKRNSVTFKLTTNELDVEQVMKYFQQWSENNGNLKLITNFLKLEGIALRQNK